MSFLDTVLGDTVGVVWSAASGTVDPWTKANLEESETENLQTAGADSSTASQQASSDVTTALSTFNGGSADPSDFSAGISRTASNVTSAVTSTLSSTKGLLVVVAIAAVAIFLLLGRARSTVGV